MSTNKFILFNYVFFVQNGSRHGSDEIDVRMLVHQSQAGCVIGKGGLKIKELREVSHF